MKVNRGDVFLVNLEPVVGSEQGRIRPAVVIQKDILNEKSPTIIVAPITAKIYSKEYPTNVVIKSGETGLKKESTILLNQLKAIDKSRIIKEIGRLDVQLMKEVDMAIRVCMDLE